MEAKKKSGAERLGTQRQTYERNRAFIIKSQNVCGICGRPVDKELKAPHPLSATVDHIIPIAKGGQSNLENLQLSHWICNRIKSDKLTMSSQAKKKTSTDVGTRNLPHLMDWTKYKSK